jgi:hypothetical protein
MIKNAALIYCLKFCLNLLLLIILMQLFMSIEIGRESPLGIEWGGATSPNKDVKELLFQATSIESCPEDSWASFLASEVSNYLNYLCGLCSGVIQVNYLRKAIFPLQNVIRDPLKKGDAFPFREFESSSLEEASLAKRICLRWLEGGSLLGEKGELGKGKGALVIFSSFLAKDLGLCDPQIESQTQKSNKILQEWLPAGTAGTRHILHPTGDYDFSLVTLTAILYRFKGREDILYPETRKHLEEVMLNVEGGDMRLSAPNTFWLIGETENHVLMTESSRYLKNRHMQSLGREDFKYDNYQNGMEEKILRLLISLKEGGLTEFNSRPYIGYTLGALHNLADYGSCEVKKEATELLDYVYGGSALGSLWSFKADGVNVQEYPPFQRKLSRAKETSLTSSYVISFLKPLLAKEGIDFSKEDLLGGLSGSLTHSLRAAGSLYHLPQSVVNLILKKNSYFAQLGHGVDGSPEIYYAGSGFLLSAGGVHRSSSLKNPLAEIVARPICLFLDGKAKDLKEVIHLKGRGSDFRFWNNTGVYKNFACSNGDVSIPEGMEAKEVKEDWSLYSIKQGLSAVIHTKKEGGNTMSLLILFEKEVDLDSVIKANSSPQRLRSVFQFPDGGAISYDLSSNEDQYVITAVDGKAVDRDFDRWPLVKLEGLDSREGS